jgi:Domain of unknown function (DUF4333)
MRKLSALIGVSALVVALASACGVSVGPRNNLSAASVAREVSSQLAKDYPTGLPAPVVLCPDGIPATKGATFVCTTVLDGQPLDLDGTVTSPNGHYKVVPRDPIILIPVLENTLTTDIANQTLVRPSKVDCGARQVAVVAVGGTITCWATFPRVPASRRVVTTVLKDGSVSYTLSQ